MTPWNAHQKRLRALRQMQRLDRLAWQTRQRRTPSERRINTLARSGWARAWFRLQDCAREF